MADLKKVIIELDLDEIRAILSLIRVAKHLIEHSNEYTIYPGWVNFLERILLRLKKFSEIIEFFEEV